MAGGKRSGAPTLTSPNFDPGASEFVPTCTPHLQNDSSSTRTKMSFSFQGSFDDVRAIDSTVPKVVRPPLALYSSSTWSPTTEQPVRSAGIPPKQSWDSFLDPNISLQPETSLLSPAHLCAKRVTQPDSTHIPRDAPSSGLEYSRGDNRRIVIPKASPGLSGLRYTQTEEYHNSGIKRSPSLHENCDLTIQTDPLPQNPFGWAGPATVKSSSTSGGSILSQHQKVPDAPHSTASHGAQSFNGTENRSSEDQQSEDSASVVLSDHYTDIHPEQAGAKSEVWSERPHPHSIRRALKDGNVEWVEAYQGAVKVLSALNPAVYQMPFGTRVINIKTEYYRNVLKSITCGKYSVMPKVAERIMKVWNYRENSSEKVLLLFSINGSKRFCGIAEMSGQWIQDDSIEGWENLPNSEASAGTFAVTWLYVKDVAYHQFNHIRQPSNGNPVGNMWNGMNFPSEIGRQVIQVYVESPATSSILGQPKSSLDTGLPMNYRSNYDQRRGNFHSMRGSSLRGGRGGLRSAPAPLPNWRQQCGPQTTSDSEDENTPVPDKLAKAARHAINSAKPLEAGVAYSVTVNEHGQVVFLPSDEIAHRDTATSNAQAPAHNLVAQGVLHSSRSVGDLNRPGSSFSSMRPSTASSSHGLLLPTLPANGMGTQRFPVMPPQVDMSGYAFYGNAPFGLTQRQGEDTPTHRPASRGARSIAPSGSQQSTRDRLPLKDLSINMLNVKYYRLVAEQYALKDELANPDLGELKTRSSNAKMSELLTQMHEVQAQLAVMGVTVAETKSAVRRDSSGSGDQTSTSTGYHISPVRAEDGRRLRSVSKIKSPPLLHSKSEPFDRAPGGSGRQKGHARGCTDSWDSQVKKSITDLLKSPEREPAPFQPVHETSNFSNSGSGDRKPYPYAAPGPMVGKPTASQGLQGFSFPAPSTSSHGTPIASSGSKDFTLPARLSNSFGTPTALDGSKSFTFAVPTMNDHSTPNAMGGSKSFGFGSPAPNELRTPTGFNSLNSSHFLVPPPNDGGTPTSLGGTKGVSFPIPTNDECGENSTAPSGSKKFGFYNPSRAS